MAGLLHKIALVFFCGLLLAQMTACNLSDSDRVLDTPLEEKEVRDLDWQITVGLVQKNGGPRLSVKETFVMPRKRLVMRLPDTYLRKENLYQRIEDLKVSEPGQLLPHPSAESVRILEHPQNEKVTIEYLFRPDDPVTYTANKESFSAPIIRDDYFQFVGSMAIIYPIAISNVPSFALKLDWQLPQGFSMYNSFGAEVTTQNLTTDFDKVRDAFVVAGKNIRAHKISVRGRPVFVTFEGSWAQITDESFVDVVSRLLAEQRETFRDDQFPYFLVNFLAEDMDCGDQVKFAGTAHPNSFRAIFPGGMRCTLLPEMRQLISHELMHMWIGKKIRVGEERGHIDGKWFTEGFTDFFGRLLAYRAGVLTQDEYFSSLNRQLEKYYISNERMTTLTNLVERMYLRGQSTRALEEVPYQQGEIMAWRLNKRIKLATMFKKSLDDVIRDMLADAERAGGAKKFTVKEISSYIDRYAAQAFGEEFNKIVRGGLFTPPILANCSPVQNTFVTKFQKYQRKVSDMILFYGTTSGNCDAWLK